MEYLFRYSSSCKVSKECGLSQEPAESKTVNELLVYHKFEKRKDDIKSSFEGKSFNPLDRQLKEKFNQRLKEYKIMCNSKSRCIGTLE